MLGGITNVLRERWNQPLAAEYVCNTPVLQNLLAALSDGDPIVELVGMYGTGKTTLLRPLTTSYFSKDAADFAAEVHYQLSLKDFIDLKLLLAPCREA